MHDCSAWRPDRSHRSQLLCQTPREWWWCPASTAHLDVQDLVFIRFFRLPNTEYWHGWGARLAVHCASPFCSSAHTGLCPAESAPTDVHRAALTLPDAGTQGREPGRRSQWQLPPRPFATRPAACVHLVIVKSPQKGTAQHRASSGPCNSVYEPNLMQDLDCVSTSSTLPAPESHQSKKKKARQKDKNIQQAGFPDDHPL
jgi:hypothetical protein